MDYVFIICFLGILLCFAAGKIVYDLVVIDSLREKIKRRDIVIDSMARMNRERWIKENASVGIIVESDTTFNGQENTL